ncbi:MAG: transcription elongation factor Spt5 [Methanococci archaeon]|uniref:Transcription elongation factor Spt5 n=1 Tax=Methanocaldococcus vulcanius (strain ATCC 700851 / DSM 12094 / M7) TaxID=579137 RepID=C9RGT3_METVM|nr:transcription elongation factor Spt5 [Methanocaldococcus vulcanius]ACX72785.1 NusG antitermination factor [Methanocaldococcus vulcanius M7]NPA62515.1 transcription elongation factor Spt5 [Methanococci archaeon]
MIFAVRTMVGQEKNIAGLMASRAEKEQLDVHSILASESLKGYVLVEAETKGDVEELIKGMPRIRGIVPGTISIEEIEPLLTPKKIIENIEKGDVVEIIAGPFKGERAKVIRVDKHKEEVTLELENAAVPIPITLPVEGVKIVSKHKD